MKVRAFLEHYAVADVADLSGYDSLRPGTDLLERFTDEDRHIPDGFLGRDLTVRQVAVTVATNQDGTLFLVMPEVPA